MANIVMDYDWTSAPRRSEFRKQAPYVWVKSFTLNSNQIDQMIKGYTAIAGSAGGNAKTFYDKMYSESTSPDKNYRFPFFGDNVRSFGNNFGDTFQNGIGGGGGIGESAKNSINTMLGLGAQIMGSTGGEALTNAGKQFTERDYSGAVSSLFDGIKSGGDPGSYVETPMFYQFEKNDAPLEVSFVLSNTINSDYIKNHDLTQELTKMNRPMRKDSIAVDPPKIYQVKVPGHRMIRWAYCSNFSVGFLGTRRMIDKKIIPEGYKIDMTFTSLTLEHAGFLEDTTVE